MSSGALLQLAHGCFDNPSMVLTELVAIERFAAFAIDQKLNQTCMLTNYMTLSRTFVISSLYLWRRCDFLAV